MTLPPFGIVFRRGRWSERLHAHELGHWRQYQKHGLVWYYLGYVWAWVKADFSYTNHPWEAEAWEFAEELLNSPLMPEAWQRKLAQETQGEQGGEDGEGSATEGKG